MAKYWVNNNAQSNGDHEVHREGCRYLPLIANKSYLGDYNHCSLAVKKSKEDHHKQSNGCFHCSPECHTT